MVQLGQQLKRTPSISPSALQPPIRVEWTRIPPQFMRILTNQVTKSVLISLEASRHTVPLRTPRWYLIGQFTQRRPTHQLTVVRSTGPPSTPTTGTMLRQHHSHLWVLATTVSRLLCPGTTTRQCRGKYWIPTRIPSSSTTIPTAVQAASVAATTSLTPIYLLTHRRTGM